MVGPLFKCRWNANGRASELKKVEWGHQELLCVFKFFFFFFIQRQAFGQLWFRLVMQSPIHFREPVLFGQFGSLNRFKKPIHRLLTLSSNDVTTHLFFNNSVLCCIKHSNKVICVNAYWNIQIKSYFCERILLIIAFHSLTLIMFVVTVSFADPLWQIRLTNID